MNESDVRFDYSGCTVLVTGGSNGIGHAVARAFADAGANVTITGRRESAGDYETDLTGLDYRPLEATDGSAIEDLAKSFDRLDVLVNNAGGSFPDGRDEWIPDAFEKSLALNLSAAFRLSVAVQPIIAASKIEGGGSVINVASMSSFFAVPMVPGYGAAKAGIVQMTKNLAATWASKGVRVNAVAPGLIESNLTSAMKGIPDLEGPFLDRTPMGRWGTPADIAQPVLFLASPAARFVTGQTLAVDGGYSIA